MVGYNLMGLIKKRFEILKAVAFVTYKEWAAYRTHAMVSIFVGPVYYLVQMYIWRALYVGHDTIQGMTLQNMLTYFGISAVISYLTMDFADWNFQMLIHTGKYLTFMLRPVHHRYFALCQKFGHRFLGLWTEFLPVFLIFIFVFRINLMPASVGWALLSIGLSFMMVFYTNYCIGLSAFWITKTSGLRSVFSFLSYALSGSLFPLTFFPEAVQKLLFFLPFQYTTYVPIRVYVGSYELGGISLSIPMAVGTQALAVLIMALLSELMYRLGLRRFTGVGA